MSRVVNVLAVVLAVVGSRSLAQEPPRYRFEPGQVLNYETRIDTGSVTDMKLAYAFVVLQSNADGGWRLFMKERDKGTGTVVRLKPMQLAVFDISPTGEIPYHPTLGYTLNPWRIFPQLPANDAETDWKRETHNDDAYHYHLMSKPGAPEMTIECKVAAMWDKIYLSSQEHVIHFDRAKGLPTTIDLAFSQRYGFNQDSKGLTSLVSVERRDADWLAKFRRDVDTYIEASLAVDKLRESAESRANSALCVLDLGKAKRVFEEARGKIEDPELREAIDNTLRFQTQMIRRYVESASSRAKILNHPVADWETKDLEGNDYSSEKLQGKVVVMDFWYRGCGWCVRAMPQMNQLVEDFKDQPVAILGMNIDEKDEDALFVIKEMELRYPTLHAKELLQPLGMQFGFPTIFLIDQKGVLRYMHVGYSPTLREDLGREIRKLLEKPATP